MRKLREKLQTNLFNKLWWMRKVGKMSKYCGGGPRTVFSIFWWRLMHEMDYCSSGSTDRLSIDLVTTISSCISNSSGDAEWYSCCCHIPTSGCLFTTSKNTTLNALCCRSSDGAVYCRQAVYHCLISSNPVVWKFPSVAKT